MSVSSAHPLVYPPDHFGSGWSNDGTSLPSHPHQGQEGHQRGQPFDQLQSAHPLYEPHYSPYPSCSPHLQRPSYLPPPFVPDEPTNKNSETPYYSNPFPHMAQAMVYPPPAPGPRSSVSSMADPDRKSSIQLPSMDSWAPPHFSPRVGQSPSMRTGYSPRSSDVNGIHTMSINSHKRRPSDAEEVEAGMALAGLGLGLTVDQVKARRDSMNGFHADETSPKKAKRDKVKKEKEGKEVKEAKDGRKSCSECRRLKAKCDRVFPCSNCRRRGCALVCPDGDLSCMQGKRLVLASTEQLHERIAQLEVALSHAHCQTSSSQHPLLAPEHLDGGFANSNSPEQSKQSVSPAPPLTQTPSNYSTDQTRVASETSPKDLMTASTGTPIDAVGMTSYGTKEHDTTKEHETTKAEWPPERGGSRGRMSVECLLADDVAAPEGKTGDQWVGVNAAPALIVGSAANTEQEDTDDRRTVADRLRKILRILPPREVARRHSDSFFAQCKWYNFVLAGEEYYRVYEPAVYAPTPANPLSPHKLACVLMVLTLATYFDLTNEEDNPEVGRYWEGAQRCFDTRFGWSASIAGVQALALATFFVAFGWRGAKASNFYWLRQMTTALQQLGLHKDPHPSLPEEERDFRRRVFHEAFSIDCLISINHGQRTGILVENIETQFPTTKISNLQKTKYQYMQLVKAKVIELGCRPDRAPATWEEISATSQIIMKYDARCVAEIHCPLLRGEPLPPPKEDSISVDVATLINTTTSMCHYKAMLFLFRPLLRRLITRLRDQPVGEPVVFSDMDRETVSMTFTACRAIIACSRWMGRTHPRLSARCWAVWVQALSAAVSIAALAIWCGPHLDTNFVDNAYKALTEACEAVQENGSQRSKGVLALFPHIQSIVNQRYPQVVGRDPSTAQVSEQGEAMLFALLGGQAQGLGISPVQGPLMNPPWKAPQSAQTSALQPSTSSDSAATTQVSHDSQIHAPHPSYPAEYNQAGPTGPFLPGGPEDNLSYPLWNANGQMEMVLPVVDSQPVAGPFGEQYPPYTQGNQQGYGMPSTDIQGAPTQVNGNNGQFELDSAQFWTRLQTFYEPTPVYWGQSVGVAGTDQGPNGDGYVASPGGPMRG